MFVFDFLGDRWGEGSESALPQLGSTGRVTSAWRGGMWRGIMGVNFGCFYEEVNG